MDFEARTARDRLDRLISYALRALRFYWLIVGSLALGGSVALTIALIKPRVYKSEAVMVYHPGIRSEFGGDEGSERTLKLGQKLKEVLLSRPHLQQIIDEFRLYPRIVEEWGYVDAVDEMRTHINFRVREGNTFYLSFESGSAAEVQKVTDRLAHALVEENSRDRVAQTEDAKKFLDSHRQEADADLRAHEKKLAEFLAAHPEFAKESAQAQSSAGTAIRAAASKQDRKNDPALATLSREQARLRERLDGPKPVTHREELALDPRLVAAKNDAETELRAAQKDAADKAAQFTEQHPDVRAAKSRLRAAESRLQRAQDALAQAQATARGLQPWSEPAPAPGVLEASLEKVNREISAYKRSKKSSAAPSAGEAAAWIVELETEWTQLNRAVAESRSRLQQLDDKSFKAQMAESAATSNAQMAILEPAYKPTHPDRAKLGRTGIVLLGVVLSFFLGCLLAVAASLFDDHIYDRVDIERLEVAPLVGVIPRDRTSRKVRRSGG